MDKNETGHWPTSPEGLNLYTHDLTLQRFLQRQKTSLDAEALQSFGEWINAVLEPQARYSDRFAPPRLVDMLSTPGIPGERTKEIIFNPAYLDAQRDIYQRGIIGQAYKHETPNHMVSFVMGYLTSKSDISTHCPVTLTGAVAYILHRHANGAVRDKYLPELTRMDGLAKTGGTWVTEKHSGTNAGATTCTAHEKEDGTYALFGEKWFASNAKANIALALARPVGAVSGNKGAGLYLVPDVVDGQANTQKITALKDKLGTRGLATVELDLNGCTAIEIVPPPHGLRVMMEALEYSRVHNAMSAAGVSHRILVEALCYTDNRAPFGKKLCDEPMIRQELIALTSEWRASSAMAFQAAAVFDKPEDAVWARMMTAMAKWYTAESAVQSANTLIELIGGMAYTTDMQAERLLRDAKVLQVWEGPKQVQARALARTIIADKNNTLSTRLWQICDAIPDGAADLRRAIARELRDLDYNVRQLKESPKSEDQIGSMLLRQAADVTALTLLSDQAAWEMVQYGDDRTVLVARHFYDQHFGERHQVKHIADALQTRFNDVARMTLTSPVNDNVWPTPSENKTPRQSPCPSPK